MFSKITKKNIELCLWTTHCLWKIVTDNRIVYVPTKVLQQICKKHRNVRIYAIIGIMRRVLKSSSVRRVAIDERSTCVEVRRQTARKVAEVEEKNAKRSAARGRRMWECSSRQRKGTESAREKRVWVIRKMRRRRRRRRSEQRTERRERTERGS